MVIPGVSAYSISKLATQCLMEYLDVGVSFHTKSIQLVLCLTDGLLENTLRSYRSPCSLVL